ncbi:MAG TPA: hypothetical protein VI363_06995, partial [Burkholderiales bacterium]
AFASSAAFAQEARDPAAERAAMLETMHRGKDIKGSRERYQHLPELLAVERAASGETPQHAIARIGAGGAQVVETKGRLVLFRSAQQRPAVVQRVSGAPVYPTVLNTRTGNFGVLTGTLVVKPKSMSDATAIANGHGLEIGKEYPQLQTVFYRVKANTDIADAAAAVQADPRVENAYPEIIEYVRTPK